MVERKSEVPLGLAIKSHVSAFAHIAARSVADIPFALRVLRAPDGELVHKGEVVAKGKVVRSSGEHYVIVREDGSMVFPNFSARDSIRLNQ